jgi:preprotein translocase subunit SecE
MKSLFNYLRESRAELAKVNWPSRRDTIRMTFAVIIFTAVFSGFIGLIDYVLSAGLQKLILKG